MSDNQIKTNYSALYTLITVFFFWGFIAAGNSIFIPFCKSYFSLDQFQSQLVDFAFYTAYYVGALLLFALGDLSGKDIVGKWGYKRSIVYGLLFSALGAGAMIVAVEASVYAGMLVGLFIVALGFSLQQTAANPFAILLGDPKTGASRVNLGGGINSLGTTIGPIVVALAVAICVLPMFFVSDYQFNDWLYRALIFLVISCPCALVISIPLGYFGGIGAASKNGILFKGSNFLDVMASVQNVVMDKTGTMTEGVFKVQEVVFNSDFNKDEILQLVNALESQSTHPVATAIHQFVGNVDSTITLKDVEEISGHGLKAYVNGKELLVGNFKLMDKFSISYDIDPSSIVYTLIAVAYDKKFVGYLTIADSIKEDAQITIDKLKALGVKTTMLSGDKNTVVQFVAQKLGIINAFGDLLPEDKVNKVKEIIAKKETVAFVGDGVNDAPVVALSNVGIAMGGLGSDATIETADVVIQDDKPSKIPMAINIGKQTKKIVWQNIILAFTVKAIVLILGAGGLATMWEAVFADVGVALLAILNAVRIQRMKF